MSLFSLYIYFRLIKKITLPYAYLIFLKILFIYGLLGTILYPLQRIFKVDYYLTLLIHYAFGVFLLLIMLSIFYDLVYSFSKGVSKMTPIDEGRRKALKTFWDITFLIMGVLYFFKAFANSLKQPTINKTNVTLDNHKLNGLQILQISDLHIGDVIKKDFIKTMVIRINKLNPDIIVLTGDIVDSSLSSIRDDLKELDFLSAKYGVYMSLGNHEYYQGDIYGWINYFKNTHINLLINEHIVIDNKFNLVGIADKQGYKFGYFKPDIKKSFHNINNSLPTIVMSHQPIMIYEFDSFKPELVLSGHTHGGQIFPFGLLVKLVQKYLSGLYRHNEYTQIFVSRGAGYWGPPIRVFADNEVNLIEVA